jgi:hypothetical protein
MGWMMSSARRTKTKGLLGFSLTEQERNALTTADLLRQFNSDDLMHYGFDP